MSLVRLFGGAMLLGILLLSPLAAQARQSTTSTYDDWTVRCVTLTDKVADRHCDMEQIAEMSGKNVPVSRVAIPQPVNGKPVTMVVQLPVNVWLPAGIKLFLTDKDPGLAGKFTRCVPGGCFAQIAVNNAAIGKFRTATKPGKIVFKNAVGREVGIPVSFKGFAHAFAALALAKG